MSINQKSGWRTFRRRFVSGSLFVSPCSPECYLQSETKIEPDLRLVRIMNLRFKNLGIMNLLHFGSGIMNNETLRKAPQNTRIN